MADVERNVRAIRHAVSAVVEQLSLLLFDSAKARPSSVLSMSQTEVALGELGDA